MHSNINIEKEKDKIRIFYNQKDNLKNEIKRYKRELNDTNKQILFLNSINILSNESLDNFICSNEI